MENSKLQSSIAFIKRYKYILAAILLFLLVLSSFLPNENAVQPTAIPSPQTKTPTTVPQNNRPAERIPTAIQPLPSVAAERRAVSAVENIKEVRDFRQSVTTAGKSRLVSEVDSYPTAQEKFYRIHVYEVVPNGDGTAHAATFGWYRFFPETGTVLKD